MLSFKNLACRRDKDLLFSDISQVIYRSQKVGVTGANGCGKSSLFGLVLGELDPDEGEVELQNGITMAHVSQESSSSDRSAIDFVVDGDMRLREVERRIDESDASDGEVHAMLLAEYDACGAYTAKARAGSLLSGLGFSAKEHNQTVNSFSGGWRMRLNLAQALMCPSDLLLLDEPTNHLDLDAVLWLEQWLQVYAGSLLLISHDREFLDRTIGFIFHIENKTGRLYTGDYSSFELRRAQRLAGEQSAFVRQQKKISEIQGFVDRFRAKATKAKQAQSRLKMLERLTLIAPAHVDSHFKFSFLEPAHLPNPLIALDAVSAGYVDNVIFRNLNWSLQSGDRIGLLGMNGAGKSTLLKTIVGELSPMSGYRVAGKNLAIGYFAQHQIDQLKYDQSPLVHFLTLDPALSDSQARDMLGGFGFRGDQALQQVATLSGGEKARLALALIVHQRPNLLLMDEPTNHLDLDMRQALCEALQTFDGALVVISHDRFLLKSVADQFWLVAGGKVAEFKDDLDGYARWLNEHRSGKAFDAAFGVSISESTADTDNSHRAAGRKDKKREDAQLRRKLQPLRKAASVQERKLEKLQKDLDVVRTRLADNQLYSSDQKDALAELLHLEAQLKADTSITEENWLAALEELESVERDG